MWLPKGPKPGISIFIVIVTFVVIGVGMMGSAHAAQTALDQLYEIAQKDKEIIWDNVAKLESWQPLYDAWAKRFPKVRLRPTSSNGPTLAAKIILEYGAGRVSMDVGQGSVGGLMPLIERDLLQRYEWTGFEYLNPFLHLEGRFVANYFYPWCIFYNKNLVSEAEAPHTWEDLLAPRWKTKICFDKTPYYFIPLALAWGEKRATEYVKKIATQQVVPAVRIAQIWDRVARGESLIGNGPIPGTLREIRNGHPFAISKISPQYSVLLMDFAPKGIAHPNAAKLFMAWLRTPEARVAVNATEYGENPEQTRIVKECGINHPYEDTVEKSKMSNRLRIEYGKIMGFLTE